MSDTILPAGSLDNLKTYLRISSSDSSKDALLNLLLESCTQAAEVYIGRYIIARDIIEEPHDFDGVKSRYLQLDQYPVCKINSIIQNGESLDVASLKVDMYNGLVKKSSPWRGVVLVSYKAGIAAGLEDVPKNIQLALWRWIESILSEQESGGLKSETLGDYSVSYYDERQIPPASALLLESYRKVNL